MTARGGANEPADPSAGPPEPPLDHARILADLEARADRLERFVQGLASVLERFEAALRGDEPADVLTDFEAPDASHEAIRVLTEAATSTRSDLAILRRDVRALELASPQGVEPGIVAQVGEVGIVATAVAERFEAFHMASHRLLGASALPPASPAALGALERFISVAVRTLRDVAAGAILIPDEGGRPPLPPAGAAASTTTDRGARGRTRRRGVPILAWLAPLRSNARAFGAALVIVGIAIVVAILLTGLGASRGQRPDASNAAHASGGSPGTTASEIAVGTAPPSESGEPDASGVPATAETSQGPGQTTAPTPPGPTPTSPGPTPTPRGPTPTPPSTPTPAPTPTLEPGAAAAEFANRVITARNAINADLNAISVAVSRSDWATAKSLAQEIDNRAVAERAWLLAHPAAACYQAEWTKARNDHYLELITIANAIAVKADAQDSSGIATDVAAGHQEASGLTQVANKANQNCP